MAAENLNLGSMDPSSSNVWTDLNDGGGGASSDDEAEEESSDDEEWNRLSAALASGSTVSQPKRNDPPQQSTTTTLHDKRQPLSSTTKSSSEDATTQTRSSKQSTQTRQQGGADVDSISGVTSDNSNQAERIQKQKEVESSSTTSPQSVKATNKPQSSLSSAAEGANSQPMQTLNKLQQMLDDTDYMTSNSGRQNSTRPSTTTAAASGKGLQPSLSSSTKEKDDDDFEDHRLWTSKDRAKYKKVQNRTPESPRSSSVVQMESPDSQRRVFLPNNNNNNNNNRPSPPIHHSSDDERDDFIDGGVGFKLPNLPVYYSDAEESDDADEDTKYHGAAATPPGTNFANTNAMSPPVVDAGVPNYYYFPHQTSPPQPPPGAIGHQYNNGMTSADYQGVPPPHYHPYSFGHQHMYGYQYPFPPYMTPQQHAYYSQYGPLNVYPPHYYQHPTQTRSPQQPQLPFPSQSSYLNVARPSTTAVGGIGQSRIAPHKQLPYVISAPARGTTRDTSTVKSSSQPPHPVRSSFSHEYTPVTIFVPPENIPDPGSRIISFDSVQKVGLTLVSVALACYAGVSPRSLPLSQYNLKFYDNLGLIGMATIAPIVQSLLVINPQENDVNAFVNTFFTSFTLGYVLAFVSEIIATTAVRLIVFTWFEPKIFSLAPKVPVPIIPWVLRETGYRPKRITLLAAEIAASCLVCPILEEYIKLSVMQYTSNLKRNFVWTKRRSSPGTKKSGFQWVAEPILRPPNEPDIVNANHYVSQMLAASLGLKLCDAGRRILLYTKDSNPSKSFYAACRGAFPIQELCGTMTALGLAKKNLLGVRMPLWKLLFPAVLIHGMANFRGKKPVYRWGSATPWSEMQLPAFHVLNSLSLSQLLSKGFAKIMWLIIIFRVTGYCVKNYFMVNRQAVKRTTTYAGKPAAFSAELTATEMLKKK